MTLVGIVPAAGRATRLGPLPCSKELLPVGMKGSGGEARLRPVCSFLMDQFRVAGVEVAYVVLRTDKWDIPAYLGSGESWGVDVAYLTLSDSPAVPSTIARAVPYVRDGTVALGFPDIILRPHDVFLRLSDAHAAGGADVTLGLFPTDQPAKVDMVDFDERSFEVTRVDVKPARSDLKWTWMCALWEPSFTELLEREAAALDPGGASEVHLGHIFQKAIGAGQRVRALPFRDGWYRDIGTPEDLRAALREFS